MLLKSPLLLLVFLFLCAGNINAQNAERDGLRGVSAVRVLIEELPPDAIATGLNDEQLQADVELRLRKASIRVVSSGFIFLRIAISAHKISESCGIASHIQVEFNRPGAFVSGSGDSVRMVATVWAKSMLSGGDPQDFSANTRKSVADLCDIFLNDYLAAKSIQTKPPTRN